MAAGPGLPPSSSSQMHSRSMEESAGHRQISVGVQGSDGRKLFAGADLGDGVYQLVVIGSCLALVGVVHAAPLVPREHLDLVEGGQAPDRVAADLTRSPVLGAGYAEVGGIDAALPEGGPGLPAGQELTAGQILRPLQDVQA